MPEQETKRVARTTAWIDQELIHLAKAIAGVEGSVAQEVIEEELRPALQKRWKKALKAAHDLGGEG